MQRRPYAFLQTIHGKLPAAREISILKSDFAIGRSSTADLQLDDPRISRLQAMIYYRQDGWFIQDKSSNQNTLVNGKKVRAARLKSGDHIRIGDNEFIFYINDYSIDVTPVSPSNHVKLPNASPSLSPQKQLSVSAIPEPFLQAFKIRRIAFILLLIFVSSAVLLWISMYLYLQNRLSQGKKAYTSGECQTSLSILAPISESRLSSLFPPIMKEAEKISNECQSYINWQQFLAEGDVASSKQAYQAFAQSFPNSPLLALAKQNVLDKIKSNSSSPNFVNTCDALVSYKEEIIAQMSKEDYVSLVLDCGEKAEIENYFVQAFQYYLDAIHQFAYDPLLTPVYQAIAQTPHSCENLDVFEADPALNNSISSLIAVHQNCIQKYLEIGSMEEASRILDKLVQLMRRENQVAELIAWLGDQTFYCGYIGQLKSIVSPAEDDLLKQFVSLCEQEYLQKGDYLSAIRFYDTILPLTGNSLTRPYAQLLFKYAATFRQGEANLKRSQLISSEKSEILLQNGSIYPMRVVLIGIDEVIIVEIPACSSQETCLDSFGRCTVAASQDNISLLPGTYDVAVLWLNPEPVDGEVFRIDVAKQSSYQWCLSR